MSPDNEHADFLGLYSSKANIVIPIDMTLAFLQASETMMWRGQSETWETS